jgi:hypothetical protein
MLAFVVFLFVLAWWNGIVSKVAQKREDGKWQLDDLWGVFQDDITELVYRTGTWKSLVASFFRILCILFMLAPQLKELPVSLWEFYSDWLSRLADSCSYTKLPDEEEAAMVELMLTDVVEFHLLTVTRTADPTRKAGRDVHTSWSWDQHVTSRTIDDCTLGELCLGHAGLMHAVSNLQEATTRTHPFLFEKTGGNDADVSKANRLFRLRVLSRISKYCGLHHLANAAYPSSRVPDVKFYFAATFEHPYKTTQKVRVFLLTEDSLDAVAVLGDRADGAEHWKTTRWDTLQLMASELVNETHKQDQWLHRVELAIAKPV